jgi:hypothetical protein
LKGDRSPRAFKTFSIALVIFARRGSGRVDAVREWQLLVADHGNGLEIAAIAKFRRILLEGQLLP